VTVRAVQALATPKHVSRTKRKVSTECWGFSYVEIPDMKLMYRPDALIQGENASEFVATPAVSGPINVVKGLHPSEAVAPRHVSRKKTFVSDFDASATMLEAAD